MSPFNDQPELKAAAFDVTPRRKKITLFKIGKLWVFEYFFEDKEMFKTLAEFYNDNKFRFEFKTFGERNNALKILERNGFDYELVRDLRPFVIKLSRYSKYAPLLKNSVAYMETPDWRIFLMKDSASVEEAVRMGLRCIKGIIIAWCLDRMFR